VLYDSVSGAKKGKHFCVDGYRVYWKKDAIGHFFLELQKPTSWAQTL
jgi:hypothetical protein